MVGRRGPGALPVRELILDVQRNMIFRQSIRPYFVKELLLKFPEYHFEFITEDRTYVRIPRSEYIQDFQQRSIWRNTWVRKTPEEFEEYLSQYVFDADVSEICDREILKINCLELDPERYRRLEDHIRQNSDKVVNAPFEPKVFELTDREVDKGKAVERVMCIVGAEREEVAVFGDGDNDIFMLGRFRCGWQFPEQMPRQILEWRRDGDQAGDCIMH